MTYTDPSPSTQPVQSAEPPRRKRHRVRNWIVFPAIGLASLITAAGIAGAATSGGTRPAPKATASATSAPASFTDQNGYACATSAVTISDGFSYCPADPAAVPAASNTSSAPAPADSSASTPAVATPAAPVMSAAQQQAVESAQSYLSLGQGFSKSGLFKQLTSSYGEGFTAETASFAIAYLHPNWYEQAMESAKGYMALGQGFSRQGLLEQLTSSYGEGFTEAQAEYAVAKVGL